MKEKQKEYRLKENGMSKGAVKVYKAIENGIVEGYKKIEDAFVEKFLEEVTEEEAKRDE